MHEEIERIAAYLGLLVQHAGGTVEISAEEVAEGLPEGHVVRISITDENNVLFQLGPQDEQ